MKEEIIKLIDESKYEEAAKKFCSSLNVDINIVFLKNDKHFFNDTEKRDIYKVTLKRNSRKYSFNFGQSLKESGFYAVYGKNKYRIPRDKINLSKLELVRYIKYNYQNDFGGVKNDEIHYPKEPTKYDILACLQKYDVGNFDDFCDEFGYNNDSISAKKTYKAVVKEYDNLCKLFTSEEMDILGEIN